MKLFALTKNLHCRIVGNSGVEIKGLYHKDTEVKTGGLFFCLRGTQVDGVNFVFSAIKNGAVAIVVEQEISNISGVAQVIVKDAREAMSLIACRFFGNPADKLKIIGVTGTNGKTTITTMISKVLEYAGHKTAVVGTNGIVLSGVKHNTGMTTPDPIELQRYFSIMVRQKVEYVCMEVSAHAIDLKKICGIRFVGCIFTNLTEDHLDYFKDLSRYFLAKAKLFSRVFTNFAVINIDDDYGRKLCESINIPFKTYAINNDADIVASNIQMQGASQIFKVENIDYMLNLAGKFNVSNALAVIMVCRELGIAEDVIKAGLQQIEHIEGRFNTFLVQGKMVVVDYAHTPDGLKNVLMASREIAEGNKVISVFGCGGNRDREKRAIMGEISSRLADFTVITTDNPRFEKREDIISDIKKGVVGENYLVEIDRVTAIKKAIDYAKSGDVVLIAGKGAEPYIDENGHKIPYSDLKEIEKYRR